MARLDKQSRQMRRGLDTCKSENDEDDAYSDML